MLNFSADALFEYISVPADVYSVDPCLDVAAATLLAYTAHALHHHCRFTIYVYYMYIIIHYLYIICIYVCYIKLPEGAHVSDLSRQVFICDWSRVPSAETVVQASEAISQQHEQAALLGKSAPAGRHCTAIL